MSRFPVPHWTDWTVLAILIVGMAALVWWF